MSFRALSLQEAFTKVDDFRRPQGKRYKLQAVLVLTCLAVMHGAQSEEEVAKWGEDEGRRWLRLLGIRQNRGPSQATIQRIFRGIDRSQLEAALDHWSRSYLMETGTGTVEVEREINGQGSISSSWELGRSESSLDTLSQWIEKTIRNHDSSNENVAIKIKDSFLKEIVLNDEGVCTDESERKGDLQTQEISEAGLKIWGLDYEEMNSRENIAWK
jgi:hypothetical protein